MIFCFIKINLIVCLKEKDLKMQIYQDINKAKDIKLNDSLNFVVTLLISCFK